MGIRVHKCMGYAINDLGWDKKGYTVNDPRINSEKFYKLRDQAMEMDEKKFLDWAKDEKAGICKFVSQCAPTRMPPEEDFEWAFRILVGHLQDNEALPKQHRRHWSLDDSIVWQAEYGLGNVFLLVPPGHDTWKRYDNTIDYYEETHLKKKNGQGQLNWAKQLDCGGFYPYVGWVRFRDPKIHWSKIWKGEDAFKKHAYLEPATYSQFVGTWSRKAKPMFKGEALKHFLEDYRPVIPFEIHAALWFFREAFADPVAFLNSLRPTIYVHWG